VRPDGRVTLIGPLLFFVLLLLAVLGWLAGPPLWRAARRERIRRQPFPAAWRHVLRTRMPAFAALPNHLQLQLKKQVQLLLADIPFIGCAGLTITDEMRVLIAAQASLLLLNRPGAGFDRLRQVLVYPAAFVVQRTQADAAGLAHESRRTLSGESWQQGQVVLSWADVIAGAANPGDGHNVVIHEFAHQLDQASGQANGAPWLGKAERYARWSQVLGHEFAALRQRLALGEPGLIDAYAAQDPAEFFAVASEHFFEQPAALQAAHPVLYAELAGYYRVDPKAW